jgi:hypothetical protein
MNARGPRQLIAVAALLAIFTAGAAAAPAATRGAVDLRVCGTVAAYVPPTNLLPGALTIGSTVLVVQAGTSVPASVQAGANLCLEIDLDTAGGVVGISATANATTSVELCGVVTAFAAADADSTGLLTIGGSTLTLAAGSSLPASVQVGSNLCLRLTLNGFGQVTNGTVQANAAATVDICGVVEALVAADADSAGVLRIGGQTFTMAAASSLPASVQIGSDLCLRLTLNGFGQVTNGAVLVTATTSVEICGQVSAVAAATPTADGRLVIGSLDRVIAAGTRLDANVQAGAFLRLRLEIDAFGRITDGVVLDAGATLAEACGDVPATVPPGAPPDDGDDTVGIPWADLEAELDLEGVLDAEITAPDDDTDTAPGDTEVPAAPESGTAPAAETADDAGLLPDTASLARTLRVVATTGIPLLLLLAGLVGLTLRARLARAHAR